MQEEREQMVEIGRQMSASKLCPGTSGNQSIYNPELGLMAIKPSGIGYMETRPEDIVIMDLESHVVDGRRKPSRLPRHCPHPLPLLHHLCGAQKAH